LILFLILAGIVIGLASSRPGDGADSDEMASSESTGRLQSRIRVEVLNGSGKPGLARAGTLALREKGFDVVDWGNARTQSEEISVVLDRVGRLDSARQVAEALGILLVESEPDSTLFLDVTVRLGRDWEAPPVASPEDEEPRPWWDLRRLFRKIEIPEPSNDR
jgi:hypothetical protein